MSLCPNKQTCSNNGNENSDFVFGIPLFKFLFDFLFIFDIEEATILKLICFLMEIFLMRSHDEIDIRIREQCNNGSIKEKLVLGFIISIEGNKD